MPDTVLGEEVLITTYRNCWVDHYFEKGYKFLDPILTIGLRSILPVNWSTITKRDATLKTFFGEASEFGVGNSGLTVPVRGIHGETALFSVNSNVMAREWQLYCSKIIPDLVYLAHLFHKQVLESRMNQESKKLLILTRREQEVLRWAAKGKTAWETARILGLSEKTVSFYISNAIAKLGAVTKTQAVATILSKQMILF